MQRRRQFLLAQQRNIERVLGTAQQLIAEADNQHQMRLKELREIHELQIQRQHLMNEQGISSSSNSSLVKD